MTIQRIRTTGSETRLIFSSNDPRPTGTCNPYSIWSNVTTDDQDIYWLDGSGLEKLPVTADPGDAPQSLLPAFWGQTDLLQIVAAPDGNIYGISGGHIWGAKKDGSTNFEVLFSIDQPTNLAYYNGGLFYMTAGALKRINLADKSVVTLDTGVTAFTIDATHNWVFIAEGKRIYAYNLAGKRLCSLHVLFFPCPAHDLLHQRRHQHHNAGGYSAYDHRRSAYFHLRKAHSAV